MQNQSHKPVNPFESVLDMFGDNIFILQLWH